MLISSDSLIEWKPYCKGQVLCENFNIEEWHKIVTDVDSDRDWQQFLSDYSHIVKCHILFRKIDDTPIAFAYTIKEDDKGKVVSFHGGGWDKSIANTLLFYRGMILLVEALLNDGLKVRTACLKGNTIAYRFIKSAGFVNHLNTDTFHYFWINKKRLYNSKIYKRFNVCY